MTKDDYVIVLGDFGIWNDTEEAVLECKKCGKRKQVFIAYVSIKEKFH